MRVYLDLCCLNRPFDDQRQFRIRVESEAVLAIIDRSENGGVVWVSSEAIALECGRNPDADRRDRILLVASRASETAPLLISDFNRARTLEQLGFGAFDALHLACAERTRVDVFLSTDDRLVKLAARHRALLALDVRNPLDWAKEVLT